jgi:hypothetical protein
MHVSDNQAAFRSKEVAEKNKVCIDRRLGEIAHDTLPNHQRGHCLVIAGIFQFGLQVVFLKVRLHKPDIRGRNLELRFQPVPFRPLRRGMVELEGSYTRRFHQAVWPTVEPSPEQDKLLYTGLKRFSDQIVDQSRSYYARTSCAWPSEVKKRSHNPADHRQICDPSKRLQLSGQQRNGVGIFEEPATGRLGGFHGAKQGHVFSGPTRFVGVHQNRIYILFYFYKLLPHARAILCPSKAVNNPLWQIEVELIRDPGLPA